LWIFWRRFNRGDLDVEHPTWIAADYPRTEDLKQLAVRVASEVPDDADAVAAIRAAGGKPKEWKIAAAWMRQSPYVWEHRTSLRAARLLKAAADGNPPVPPSTEQDALFAAVERLESVPLAGAFAMLAEEVRALSELERQVVTLHSRPGWQDTDADARRKEIRAQLAELVGPRAPEASPLIRSQAASDHASGHLLRIAGLLSEDHWGR
jgi:hypothetical protein